MTSGEAAIEFLLESGMMKRLPRVGWLQRGVMPAESLADHSYRVALFAMVIADAMAQDTEIDIERVLRMALIHDLAETRFGDLPAPAKRYFAKNAKAIAEQNAFKDMTNPLDGLSNYYQSLLQEEITAETLESQIVKMADRLELLLQVVEYELAGNQLVADLWVPAKHTVFADFHPFVHELYLAIKSRRLTK